MKSRIFSFVIAFLMAAVSQAQISKAEIRATGLTCSMCSNAINKQLKSMTEVVQVDTDLNTNTFTVTLTDDNQLTPKVFKEKVEKAGFFIGSLIVTTQAEVIGKSPYLMIEESKSKSGSVQVQIIDKGYVTDKEFKKLSKKYKDINTFKLENEDDFHIKLVN